MRLFFPSLFSLALACRGLAQDIQPPEIYPYPGPTIAYPETVIAFTLLARDHQPGSLGSELDYELLAAPAQTAFEILFGRADEKFLLLHWSTPPRAAGGAVHQFVVKVTDHGTPPLSATNVINFVLTNLPPIGSIAKSNEVIVLQLADLLPGKPYFVQWADAVVSTNWSDLVFFSPASSSIAITDTNPPAAQRFYRLRSNGWCHGFGCP